MRGRGGRAGSTPGSTSPLLILRRGVGLSAALLAATQCGSDFLFVPVPVGTGRAPQLSGGVCWPGAIDFEPVSVAATGQDLAAGAIGDVTGDWHP